MERFEKTVHRTSRPFVVPEGALSRAIAFVESRHPAPLVKHLSGMSHDLATLLDSRLRVHEIILAILDSGANGESRVRHSISQPAGLLPQSHDLDFPCTRRSQFHSFILVVSLVRCFASSYIFTSRDITLVHFLPGYRMSLACSHRCSPHFCLVTYFPSSSFSSDAASQKVTCALDATPAQWLIMKRLSYLRHLSRRGCGCSDRKSSMLPVFTAAASKGRQG